METALALSSAPSPLVGFCGTLVGGLGIRSAGQGSVSSVPGGTLALVAAGCFHGSQELEYNREEADGSLRWVCQRTEGKRLQNRELQDIEARVRARPALGLLQLPVSVHIVYPPEKPPLVPLEGTRGQHRPPSEVAVPAPW